MAEEMVTGWSGGSIEVGCDFLVSLVRREAHTAFLRGARWNAGDALSNADTLKASYDYAARRAEEARAALLNPSPTKTKTTT